MKKFILLLAILTVCFTTQSFEEVKSPQNTLVCTLYPIGGVTYTIEIDMYQQYWYMGSNGSSMAMSQGQAVEHCREFSVVD